MHHGCLRLAQSRLIYAQPAGRTATVRHVKLPSRLHNCGRRLALMRIGPDASGSLRAAVSGLKLLTKLAKANAWRYILAVE